MIGIVVINSGFVKTSMGILIVYSMTVDDQLNISGEDGLIFIISIPTK